jgi:hypothetical protein
VVPRLEGWDWNDSGVDNEEKEEDVLVVKHQDQVAVFSPKSSSKTAAAGSKDNAGEEETDGDVSDVEEGSKLISFTFENEEEPS